MPFDWSRFESDLTDLLLRALRRFAASQTGSPAYALMLWHVYRERDAILSLPTLAVGIEDGKPARDERGFWSARYNPADLSHPELELDDEVALGLERALVAEATRDTVEHWDQVEARLFRVLIRVVRRLRDTLPDHLPVTPDFVAFLSSDDGGPDLARRTIPKRRFERLFPEQVDIARSLAASRDHPDDARARLLVSRFGSYDGISTETAQEELVAMGDPAIPALVDGLAGEHAWTAASVLGRIGTPDPEAIETLRAGAHEQMWFAMALGMLGDHDWLAEQSADVAVQGLTARLKAITKGRLRLDHRPLEGLLDRRPELRERVERQLAPGRSYASITAADVPASCRGMGSRHAVVRWHATSVAGDRGLGEKAGEQLIPAIATGLEDPHPLVRRLALLSLKYWRSQAKQHRPAMARLLDDPDETVRNIAAHSLG